METQTSVTPRDAFSRGRGASVTPIEFAEAAVLADVICALCLASYLFPAAAILGFAAVLPAAVLGARHRRQVIVLAWAAAASVALLLGGFGLVINVTVSIAIGALAGRSERDRWSQGGTVIRSFVFLGIPSAVFAVGYLWIFSSIRVLLFKQVTNLWTTFAKILNGIGLHGLARFGSSLLRWFTVHWALAITVTLLVTMVFSVIATRQIARPVLRRISRALDTLDGVVAQPASPGEDETGVGPVPVVIDHATFTYQGADDPALRDVSVSIGTDDYIALVGANGSGKSTLASLIAGRTPTSGSVLRPGGVGIGRVGGTAIVYQRPETQILGVTVRDDVLWGIASPDDVDLEAVLEEVGLAGFAQRETDSLSGGELQRLCLAAAIARSPSLLICDEVTAMVDPNGRAQLLSVLDREHERGRAIVHITHRDSEAARASRTVALERGRIVNFAADSTLGAPLPTLKPIGPHEPILLSLKGVGHVYGDGTPWSHRALDGIDLDLQRGEGVLIVGHNGSGKSTLAHILVGLEVPSVGTATMEGRPISEQIGAVALSFQHARLQLVDETVEADIIAASGGSDGDVTYALDLVGLDASIFRTRRIDELSGGEQRRVALAGLLASRPKLLVLDEPFAGLDREAQRDFSTMLARLRRNSFLTVVVVSHDTEGLEAVVHRTIRLEKGTIAGSTPSSEPPKDAKRRRRGQWSPLRPVPGTSAIHELSTRTKLLGLLCISLVLSITTTWTAIGAMAVLVLAALLVGHIPASAFPTLPKWFYALLALGAIVTGWSGGKPFVHFGHRTVGLGGIESWAKVTAIGAIIIIAALVLSWTTHSRTVPPALVQLMAPLGRLGVPVVTIASAVGLAFRCVPLLIEEISTIWAVRRLRAPHQPPPAEDLRSVVREAIGLLAAALIVSLRRAHELARAIDARGGATAAHLDRDRFSRRDLIAAITVTAGVAVALAV